MNLLQQTVCRISFRCIAELNMKGKLMNFLNDNIGGYKFRLLRCKVMLYFLLLRGSYTVWSLYNNKLHTSYVHTLICVLCLNLNTYLKTKPPDRKGYLKKSGGSVDSWLLISNSESQESLKWYYRYAERKCCPSGTLYWVKICFTNGGEIKMFSDQAYNIPLHQDGYI